VDVQGPVFSVPVLGRRICKFFTILSVFDIFIILVVASFLCVPSVFDVLSSRLFRRLACNCVGDLLCIDCLWKSVHDYVSVHSQAFTVEDR
jgi:hypothetical protein